MVSERLLVRCRKGFGGCRQRIGLFIDDKGDIPYSLCILAPSRQSETNFVGENKTSVSELLCISYLTFFVSYLKHKKVRWR